jgi:hypothetical protein
MRWVNAACGAKTPQVRPPALGRRYIRSMFTERMMTGISVMTPPEERQRVVTHYYFESKLFAAAP